MPRPLPRLALTATLGAMLLLIAGCASSISSNPSTSPTSGRTPASAATGTPDAAYVQAATSVLDGLAGASDQVAAIMQRPDVTSSTWLSSLTKALGAFDNLQTRAQQLKVPAADAAMQQQLVDVANEFQQVATLLKGGINPPDATKLEQASQALQDAISRAAVVRATLGSS